MKPISPSELSDGVLAVSDDLSTKLTRALSKSASGVLRGIAADLKAGRFEEAKTAARELEFTTALKKNAKTIRKFMQSAALVGTAAIDRPQTSVMAQAGFPYEVDVSSVTLMQNMVNKMLTQETRRRVLAQIGRAERFQKASDPIDPDKLANDINRYLRGEIRRVVDVSANITGTRVASYGMLYEARARGITRYRIDAVLDDRTTDICRSMNGREFTVEEAYTRTSQLMSITDPADLKSAAPFPTINEIKGQTNQQLQDMGYTVPPFHFLCRSVVTLIGTDTEYEPVEVSRFDNAPRVYTPDHIDKFFAKLEPYSQAAIKVDNQDELLAAKKIADQMVDHPGGDGTAARAYAVNAYTGNYFNTINNTLRHKGHWESEDAKAIAHTMDRVMDSLPPLEEDMVVYRGAAGVVLDQLDDIGKVVQDDGFVSTSFAPQTAGQFGRKDAILQILIPKGGTALPLGDLSLTKYEAEIVLPRSTQFRVVGTGEIDVPDTNGKVHKEKVIKVVAVGQNKTPDLDNLPSFEEWIAAQESLIKLNAEEERLRAKFVYTSAKDIFPISLS